jgi:hypothetical protein
MRNGMLFLVYYVTLAIWPKLEFITNMSEILTDSGFDRRVAVAE